VTRDPLPRFAAAVFVATSVCCAAAAAEKTYTLTVSAGDLDRRESPASVRMPAGIEKGVWQLKADDGSVLPLQVEQGGRGFFVLKDLKAGQKRQFKVESLPGGAARSGVTVARKDGGLDVSIDAKKVLRYEGDKSRLPEGVDPVFQRGAYISAVWTPSGKLVTDDYARNHKHQHAIFSPWTKTEFEGRHPDFWNMGSRTGTVEFVAIDDAWDGPVAGGWRARDRMVDLTAKPRPKPALDETWEGTVYRAGADAAKPYFVFDLLITQTCATDSPLVLPKYHYGGLGVRGNWEWNGKDKAFFLTSEGKDRRTGNETRARWVHIGGKVGGELAGIAALDDPANFRSPQPVRLHPDMPYFCYAPSQLGDWKIEPGKPYVERYRFVVADGAPDAGELNRLWKDFAEPVSVEVR